MLRSLARPEHHLGKASARRAAVVQLGEVSNPLERQVVHFEQRVVRAGGPDRHALQELSQTSRLPTTVPVAAAVAAVAATAATAATAAATAAAAATLVALAAAAARTAVRGCSVRQ